MLDLGSRLRIEVSDDSPTLPEARTAEAHAESGRGLAIVTLLAVDSGVEVAAHGAGKTSWFELGVLSENTARLKEVGAVASPLPLR